MRLTDSNASYWFSMHRTYPAQVRGVGHPWLSEAFNRLKYESETETLLMALAQCLGMFSTTKSLTFLDVGAGNGFWTRLISEWLRANGKDVKANALDFSEEALRGLKRRFPWIETICYDLKTVSADSFESKFDLVTAFYCLHHLVRVHGFLNAVAFCARSVRKGGFLLIMDPVLRHSYSSFDAFDFAAWTGNGIPRHLYLLDDLLFGHGFTRLQVMPAVSFLFNGPIESNGWLGLTIMKGIWHFLQQIGASQSLTMILAKIMARGDRWLKRRQLSFSSSLCLYRKDDNLYPAIREADR